MLIREFREADRAAVIDLWHRAGLVRPWNDPDRDIDRKVADSPWGLLVGVARPDPAAGAADRAGRAPDAPAVAGAERAGRAPDAPAVAAAERVVASMMVGYDGHRGSVFYLAVDPARRGRGLGTALMARAEALLLARGCPKVCVSVRAENAAVIGFYARRGYRVEGADHVVPLGLRLIVDGPGPH